MVQLLWLYPQKDEAAWDLVEQLHCAPAGKKLKHITNWVFSSLRSSSPPKPLLLLSILLE